MRALVWFSFQHAGTVPRIQAALCMQRSGAMLAQEQCCRMREDLKRERASHALGVWREGGGGGGWDQINLALRSATCDVLLPLPHK